MSNRAEVLAVRHPHPAQQDVGGEVIEYIAKLRRLCEGALRCKTDVAKDQRKFWEGYRQALDDVEEFAKTSR